MCGLLCAQFSEAKNLGQWAKGLLKDIPDEVSGPPAMEPVAKFPLALAEERTKRPDFLNKLRFYVGGWDITNKHYWSVCTSSMTVVCFYNVLFTYIQSDKNFAHVA